MVTSQSPRRGDVFVVDLDPTRGHEIRKARPCVVVSPDELNTDLQTVIVAPLTSQSHPYPFRIPCQFQGRSGFLVIDQIRTVDRQRCARRLGRVSAATLTKTLTALQAMFVP